MKGETEKREINYDVDGPTKSALQACCNRSPPVSRRITRKSWMLRGSTSALLPLPPSGAA
jgi:hypothetical protein